MNSELELLLQKVLKNEEAKKILPSDYAKMEKAAAQYDDLVKDGIIKPRGYTLLTIDASTSEHEDLSIACEDSYIY